MTLEGGGGGGGVLGGISKGLGAIAKGATDVVKGVVQPIYNATLKQIPGVDNALVQLDKSVGKAIPGGWGTVAAVAASFIPGAQLAAMGMTQAGLSTGLGALSGSGVMRGKHDFNLQGAIMGGAMAYGASQLAQGLQNAADPGAVAATEAAAKSGTTETANQIIEKQLAQNAVADVAPKFDPNFDPTGGGAPTSQSFNPNFDPTGGGTNPLATVPEPPPFDPNFDPTGGGTNSPGLKALADAGKGTLSNMADAGTGIKNLTGFGKEGISGISSAYDAFKAPITMGGATAGIMGFTGMASLEERQKQLDAQLAAGNIAQSQYDAEKAKIEEQRALAQKTVDENPLRATTDPSTISNDPSLYNKASEPIYAMRSRDETLYDKNPGGGTELLYAMGGQINPPDDQTSMPNRSPMTNFEQGGMYGLGGMASNQPMSYPGYAAGGLAPRFLSGGGDGMSDSIKANINGRQEARLADGEFVVPADVVSHLGNGSSKAGAKQLYSMMDKVRTARTGRKSQGKQINPRKYLAA
jgi:hypothetical protein